MLTKEPRITVNTYDKSWYNTDDLMYENDSVLVFAGHLKRFVKLGGEMISLPAIEQVLDQYFQPGDGPQLAVTPTRDDEQPLLVLLATFLTSRQEVNPALKDTGLDRLVEILSL